VALAITGGYRGRFSLPMGLGSGNDREGLYFAFNYSYLRGFLMEDATTTLRLDTCPVPAAALACGPGSDGLLTVNSALPPPIVLSRRSSSDGRGRAIDFGVAAVVSNWELGFGVNGIANEIKWTDVEGTDYMLGNLFGGGEFDEGEEVALPDVTIEQPVEYTGNAVYRAGPLTAVGQVSKRTSSYEADADRLNDLTFRAGVEYRFLVLEPRAGAYYTRDRWQPAAGIGLNLGGFGIDAAVYTTDANVQRERKPTFALSLRIGRKSSL
jgi:hypothetical protein